MGVVVTFDYNAWVARYPEFAPPRVTPVTAAAYFNEATLYHRNDGGGPVSDIGTQQTLLNMLTAHIAELNAPDPEGAPASPLVGRIGSVSQGSVSTAVAYNASDPEQWFAQTKYGAAYWAASAQFRTFLPVRGFARRRFGLFPWTPY